MISLFLILFVTACIATAYIHGIHEGMIMIQDYDLMHNYAYPGVRGHNWFGSYHLISFGRNLLYIILGIIMLSTLTIEGFVSVARLIPGLIFACWEFAEVGYAEARGGKVIYFDRGHPYEHIYLTDWFHHKVTGGWVYALHVFRIVAGITLLIGGVL